MYRFENVEVKTKYGMVLASRIIASFTRMSWRTVKFPYGSYPMNKIFRDWLSEELEISEEDQDLIWSIASNGKSELESSASRWLNEKYRGHEEDYDYKNRNASIDD